MTGRSPIVRLLEANRGRHDMHRIFSDWVEIYAIALRNRVDQHRFDDREATFEQIRAGYTEAEMDRFAQAFAHLVTTMEDDPRDVLGEIYMQLEIADKGNGQFFTPYSISRLMADMQINDTILQTLQKQPYIEVGEPACGSAGMIVALTQTLAAHGINYQQRLHVTGEDISPVSVHMAYIQLTLLHVPALIHRRNSLTMETFDTWPTPAHVLDAWDTRLRATDLARQLHALIGTTPPATDDDDGQTPTEPATTTAPVRVTPITLDEAS
jgi:hypothetical protein